MKNLAILGVLAVFVNGLAASAAAADLGQSTGGILDDPAAYPPSTPTRTKFMLRPLTPTAPFTVPIRTPSLNGKREEPGSGEPGAGEPGAREPPLPVAAIFDKAWDFFKERAAAGRTPEEPEMRRLFPPLWHYYSYRNAQWMFCHLKCRTVECACDCLGLKRPDVPVVSQTSATTLTTSTITLPAVPETTSSIASETTSSVASEVASSVAAETTSETTSVVAPSSESPVPTGTSTTSIDAAPTIADPTDAASPSTTPIVTPCADATTVTAAPQTVTVTGFVTTTVTGVHYPMRPFPNRRPSPVDLIRKNSNKIPRDWRA